MSNIREDQVSPHFRFRMECYDRDGRKKWEDEFRNTVMILGKNYLLNNNFQLGTYTQAWYGGIMGTGTVGNTDSMGTHSGWTETTAYTGTNRPAYNPAAAVGGTSTVAALSYSMNGTYTVGGMFITTNQPVSGTVGTMYSAGFIATPRTGASGDTINITPTLVIA